MGSSLSSQPGSSPQTTISGLNGDLFLYNDTWGYAAFEVFGRGSGTRALVCLGGLTDGLLSLRYLPPLAELAQAQGWRTIQPLMTSSYSGWGQSSLASDANEIHRLLEFLGTSRGVEEVVLLGSSTGCQDVVQYLKMHRPQVSLQKPEAVVPSSVPSVKGIVLQAPVSDREAVIAVAEGSLSGEEAAAKVRTATASLAKFQEQAQSMIAAGNKDEAMPLAASLLMGPPHLVSAYRFDSLTRRLGDDDFFSSDLSDSELQSRLGHIAVPSLLAMAADDEYVPRSVDTAALGGRFAGAMAAGAVPGLVEKRVFATGGHSMRSPEAAADFSQAVAAFLCGLVKPGLAWEHGAVADIRARVEEMPSSFAGRPFLLAIAGIPCSGKTVSAAALGKLLGPEALVVPMDGFHLPLAKLKEMPDADAAVYRRGAPDTFDPAALQQCIKDVFNEKGPAEVLFPSFDHAVGDPVEGDVRFVRKQHSVVIMEGLYLLHDADGWQDVAQLFDMRLYVDADIEACISAIKIRNKCIPGYTPEEIEKRCDEVDRANALIVQKSRNHADFIVKRGSAIASKPV